MSGTIRRDQMITPMLDACPSFRPAWEIFFEEWADEKSKGAEGLPLYLILDDLGEHLIWMLKRSETENFREIFQVIEAWITRGEPYVSEAAVVGLLEKLAKSRHAKSYPDEFVQWMGPTTLKWWDEVIDFWRRVDAGKFRPLSID